MNMLRLLALFAATLLSSGCREEILHNTSERDANRLITRLHDVRIDAEKSQQSDGRWAITVPAGEAAGALRHLEEVRMFKDFGDDIGAEPSIMASREEQRFHYERAMSRELERTLGTLGGVLEARVHLHMPQSDPFLSSGESSAGGSASVLLIVAANERIPHDDVAAVIAGAAGIARDRVAVMESVSQESMLPDGAPPSNFIPQTAYAAAGRWSAIVRGIFERKSGWLLAPAFGMVLAGLMLSIRGTRSFAAARRKEKGKSTQSYAVESA
jgi:type III secretion protein J